MSSIEVNKGECLRAEITWSNDDGTPIDITGRTLSIVEAYPTALAGGTVTATDAVAGKAELFITAEIMADAGSGRVNWLRLGMQLPGGCMDTTPRIGVEVQ